MTKTYRSFGALARALQRAAERLPETYAASMEAGARAVQQDAKARIGHYQDGWPALAATTVAEKRRLGYADAENDNPLLRTGEMRDSIQAEASARGFVVGSADPVMGYQEIGTATIPPRPVLAPALHDTAPAIAKDLGLAIQKTLTGERT